MKFDKYFPTEQLTRYIKYFVVSENESEGQYKVFPSPGLVMGFQYRGQLAFLSSQQEINLAPAGVTGISDTFKIFKNASNIGSVLVYFTETGFTHFTGLSAHELFNLNVSLEDIFTIPMCAT